MDFHVLNFYLKKHVITIIYNNYFLVPQALLAWGDHQRGHYRLKSKIALALGHGSSTAHYKKLAKKLPLQVPNLALFTVISVVKYSGPPLEAHRRLACGSNLESL